MFISILSFVKIFILFKLISLAQVEDLSSPLSVEAYERLNRIDPLQQSDSFGIDIYLSCLEAIQTFDV